VTALATRLITRLIMNLTQHLGGFGIEYGREWFSMFLQAERS